MNPAYAADIAYAADAAGGGALQQIFANPMLTMIPMMFAILYFIVLRPQQKQKADRDRMLSAVKKGDRVVTTSGMHGTVIGLGEQTVTLRVADQVKLEFDRAEIGRASCRERV